MLDLQGAWCCWGSSQTSPTDSRPPSPLSPCSGGPASSSACTCTHLSEKKPSRTQPHCCFHEQQLLTSSRPTPSIPTSTACPDNIREKDKPSSPTRPSPRNISPRRGFLTKKTSSTTFILTPPEAYVGSPSTSPPRQKNRFSLQKYYYGRNTMATPPLAPAPPPASSLSPTLPTLPPLTTSASSTRASSTSSTTSSPPPAALAPLPRPSSFSRISSLSSTGPLPPLAFAGPRSLATLPPPPPSPPPASAIPFSPDTDQPKRFFDWNIVPLPPSSPPSLPTLDDHESSAPLPSSLPPDTALPLTLKIQPLSITPPKKSKAPALPTILATPLSASPPSLAISPSSPSSASTATASPQALSLSTSNSVSSSISSSSSVSTPRSSPMTSPSLNQSLASLISSPNVSDMTPYPAGPITPEQLAAMIQRPAMSMSSDASVSKQGRGRPLVLDLRPNPDFYPVSIKDSININLPTLLMRRYRRGGAVSSFALESFITMPSDKDLYHWIQDGWRAEAVDVYDVVVLDQDMKAGKEEFGRAPSPAWTLVNVLERGGGNLGGHLRLWYLEGGFDAFQAWDSKDAFLVRMGEDSSMDDVVMTGPGQEANMGAVSTQGPPALSLSMPTKKGLHPFDQNDDMSMATPAPRAGPLSLPLSLGPLDGPASTLTDEKTAQVIDAAVSLTNASLGQSPRQREKPVRRESLFSLNTKSLQRPAGLSRAQTIGVSALNIRPLTLSPTHSTQGQPPIPAAPILRHKGSWLTVPSGMSALNTVSPSSSMTGVHSSMEIGTSPASTDHNSAWSANSGGGACGSGVVDPQHQQGLSTKKSYASSTTLSSLYLSATPQGIQEEDEEEGCAGEGRGAPRSNPAHHTSSNSLRRQYNGGAASYFDAHPINNHNSSTYSNNAGANAFHQEYQSRMFEDSKNSNNPNDPLVSGSFPAGYSEDDSTTYYYDQEEGAGDDGEQEVSCILPNFLYLGPEIVTEQQVLELERLGIKRVLNMARECEDRLVVDRPGMEYHKIGVQDHIEADVSAGLMQAVDIIAASSDKPIYVHCKAGKSRSVTATIAYMITQMHWSLNKAYNHVLTQRPCMCPNIGFVTELMRMEERTLGTEKEAGGLARAGSLNSILSLSTAGSGSSGQLMMMTGQQKKESHHISLGHHSSLSTKSSMASLVSQPLQPLQPLMPLVHPLVQQSQQSQQQH